ncbi:MAG: hypothetical protein U0800_01095 [Isosphaeraceae bacterium]
MDTPPRPGGWGISAFLGLALLAAYLANGREVGSDDCEPTAMLQQAIVRGDGLVLDRFRPVYEFEGRRLPPFLIRSGGHDRSLYTPGPALLASPIGAAYRAVRGLRGPLGDSPADDYREAIAAAKFSAAMIAALVGVVLDRILRRLGLGIAIRVASVLTAGLGSGLWSIAGLSLWQHGPAALMLSVTMALLLPPVLPRWRLVAAGASAGALVVCRQIDLVFALAALGFVAAKHPRGLAWFLPLPALMGAALVAYNISTFGSILGGQARLEAMHPALHGVAGPWSGDLVSGALGTLLSPNRGLFVFTPWIVPALALVPAFRGRLKAWPVLIWMLGGLAADLLILSKYAVWWAGHCFGPRYWTDAIPLFAILLAFGLDWCRLKCRPMLVPFAATIAWAVGVQLIGAVFYPSDWNLTPSNVDTHHERLWDWRDTELGRCLKASRLVRGR